MKNISRRQFLKGTAAILGLSILPAVEIVSTPAKAFADEAKPEGKIDGKYVTKAMGHENWIYVATTIFDGVITKCEVISHEETMGIGNYACARIPAAIVKYQSVKVPNVSGSGISSNAIKTAVSAAIEEAGYDIADFSAEVEMEMSDEKIEEEADVVVVGAGTAGLVAALRLVEQGKKVCVFEKHDIPGGSMAMTYGGFFSVGSELQKNFDVTGTQTYDLNTYMGFLSPMLVAENDRYEGKMPYETALYGVSGQLVDWLHGMGVGFSSMGSYEAGTNYGASPYLAPGCYKGGAGYLAMFLANRLAALGTEMHYGTAVNGLLSDENGNVCGVTAAATNGAEYTVRAKDVVLCNGGFARNKALLEKYHSTYADQWFNCCSASTGDLVEAAEELGAYVECDNRPLPAFLSSFASKFELAFLHYSTPGIMVNEFGDSIGNFISDNHYSMGRAKMDVEKNGNKLFYIFDEAASLSTKDYETYGFDGYKALFEKGEAVHYDSLEQCAEELNLPGLAAAVEANNKASLAGEPDEFGRKNCPYIETRTGIWALRCDPTFYLSTAGLAIDVDGRVIRQDGSAIGHLYAAGDAAGSVEEKDGKKYGCGFIAATCYGWIVADVIAKAE